MKRRDALRSIVLGASTASLGPTLASAAAAPATPEAPRSVRFAHFTDAHVYAGRDAAAGLAQAIRHVHELPDRPAFVLNGGDAINDALALPRDAVEQQWQLWHAAWKDHGALPVRHCLGNHDVWGWNKAGSGTSGQEPDWGKKLAQKHLELERPYYRFDQGRWRFLVLDSLTFDAETAYRAELDGAQFAWLEQELQQTPPEVYLLIVSHIPILTVGAVGFSAELQQHPQASRMLSHVDALPVLQLLRQFPNVKLCLSGHTHLTEQVAFAGISFVNSGAVSGLWWKGNFLHTDEGYNVVDLYDDGRFQTSYQPYGWNAGGAPP